MISSTKPTLSSLLTPKTYSNTSTSPTPSQHKEHAVNKYQLKELNYSAHADDLDSDDPNVRTFQVIYHGMKIGIFIKYPNAVLSGQFDYLAAPPRQMVSFRPGDGDWHVKELSGEDFYVFSTELEACDYLNDCYQSYLDLIAS